MSVAHLSAQEFGVLAAIHLERTETPIYETAQLLERASRANVDAFMAQYAEFVECYTAEQIAAAALICDPVSDHFGPIAYNCISNNGDEFGGAELLEAIQEIEQPAKKWQDAKCRELQCAEQDAESFDIIDALPQLATEEIKQRCERAGCKRIIVAEFRVDQSDGYTDYYGGRTVRRVVIGFGKGNRENFKQLRKSAGQFPPTAHLGTGCDRWTVEANRAPDDDSPPRRGELLRDDSYRVREFTTRDEAVGAVAEIIATDEECQPGYMGVVGFPHFADRYGVEYRCESIENRETYSMGGGNYLGYSRYGGWQVASTRLDWFNDSGTHEFFDPSQPTTKPRYRLVAPGELVPA